MQGIKQIKKSLGLSLLVLTLLASGCNRNEPVGPSPATTVTLSIASTPATETTSPSAATSEPTAAPVTQADLDTALQITRQMLTQLSDGDYRSVYGSLLTTAGQQRLAELILGRLALSNPHISFFELLGAQPTGERVAVDVTWREQGEGQGDIGAQDATFYLARQGEQFLVDDVALGAYTPAATPLPPPLPKSEALTAPVLPGQEIRFRATGFQAGETVISWLELADGSLLDPVFSVSDAQGALEIAYSAEQTAGLQPGRWIWWVQALRDSSRNTGITFEVQPEPVAVEPTATPEPTAAPTATQAPTQPTARPTPRPTTAATTPPTATPAPVAGYSAPTLLWPELETTRNKGSALVVEFAPVTNALAPDEWYEMVLIATNDQGAIYNGGSVRGKGDACNGQYSSPCVQLTGNERFMELFFRDGTMGRGRWYVQVVKQTGPDQYTPISPPSEARIVLLNGN